MELLEPEAALRRQARYCTLGRYKNVILMVVNGGKMRTKSE